MLPGETDEHVKVFELTIQSLIQQVQEKLRVIGRINGFKEIN
jgi:hypothetical protein